MKLSITYKFNDKLYTTSETNDHIMVSIPEEGKHNVVKVFAIEDITLEAANIEYDHEFIETDYCFCNGYQSWTDTKEFQITEKLNNLKQVPGIVQKKYSFRSYGDIAFYEYQKDVLHGHDVAYTRGGHENVFIGNNNFAFCGIIVEFHTTKNKIVVVNDLNSYPLHEYEEVNLFNYEYETFKDISEISYFDQWKPRTTRKILGYNSWYNHFDNVNEKIILKNLDAVTEEYDLFQIDDGYETKVGDWLIPDTHKWPHGIEAVTQQIKAKGLMPGIWIAPFVAAEGSELIKEHESWLALEDGKPVKCGCNWGGFYALDFYNERVREYIKRVLRYYRECGFEFFKLDFLYAVSLPKHEGKNRSQVATEAYQFLRECLPDAIICANGALMAPSFGVFDYVRVGCSITTEWDDSWLMRHFHRERNSTKLAIQDTIYRSIFNGKVFMNDPDVFLLRTEGMKLTENQKNSLATINALFGGVLMTSDDIHKYDGLKKGIFDNIVDLAKNAKNVKYRKKGNVIEITYTLGKKMHIIDYDTETGIMSEIDSKI